MGAVFLLAFGIVFLFLMIFMAYLIFTGETSLEELKREWFLYVFGMPLLSIASVFAIYSGGDTLRQIFKIRRNPLLYIIYEHGLLIKEGDAVQAVLWRDVVDLLTRLDTYRLVYTFPKITRLKLKNGREVKFSSLVENYDELITYIETQVTNMLVPRWLARLRLQGSLTSGSLIIDKAGIESKKKRFRWAEIEKIYLQRVAGANSINVTVALRKGKGEKVLNWSDVPNPVVMMHTINMICEQYREEFT